MVLLPDLLLLPRPFTLDVLIQVNVQSRGLIQSVTHRYFRLAMKRGVNYLQGMVGYRKHRYE
jgi:hypothetical protein